jgi:hypothetical protein
MPTDPVQSLTPMPRRARLQTIVILCAIAPVAAVAQRRSPARDGRPLVTEHRADEARANGCSSRCPRTSLPNGAPLRQHRIDVEDR